MEPISSAVTGGKQVLGLLDQLKDSRSGNKAILRELTGFTKDLKRDLDFLRDKTSRARNNTSLWAASSLREDLSNAARYLEKCLKMGYFRSFFNATDVEAKLIKLRENLLTSFQTTLQVISFDVAIEGQEKQDEFRQKLVRMQNHLKEEISPMRLEVTASVLDMRSERQEMVKLIVEALTEQQLHRPTPQSAPSQPQPPESRPETNLPSSTAAPQPSSSPRILRGHVGASATAEQRRQGSSDLIVCFGEMLIDFVPTVGGHSDAPTYKAAPGGAPANVAVGIARLGGHSAFVGKVSDDEFGRMLVNVLKKNQVESRGIRFDKGARTALAFVTLKDDGEREFMFYRNPSADMLLQASELDVDLIKQASVFHYGSISLITEPCRSAHLAALCIAKGAGVLLSYDPNVRLDLWPSPEDAREGIKYIWNDADIIKISLDEVAFLTERGDRYSDEVARSLFHDNLKLLLITEGEKGCRYYTKEFQGKVPGYRVRPVDTTGAGDAFVGGFLTKLVGDLNLYKNKERLEEALYFANACGAIATTERGAIPALPDKDTVLNLMSNRGSEVSVIVPGRY